MTKKIKGLTAYTSDKTIQKTKYTKKYKYRHYD